MDPPSSEPHDYRLIRYYSDTVCEYSWSELEDMLDIIFKMRFTIKTNTPEIVEMFDVVVQAEMYEKEQIAENPYMPEDDAHSHFQLSKWFYYDYDYVRYVGRHGEPRRRKTRWEWMDYDTDYNCLTRDMIITLQIFDTWFNASYDGSTPVQLELLEDINKIYVWIIERYAIITNSYPQEHRYVITSNNEYLNHNLRDTLTAIFDARFMHSNIHMRDFVNLLDILNSIATHSYYSLIVYENANSSVANKLQHQRFESNKWFDKEMDATGNADSETDSSSFRAGGYQLLMRDTIKYKRFVEEIANVLDDFDNWYWGVYNKNILDPTVCDEFIGNINAVRTWITDRCHHFHSEEEIMTDNSTPV